MKEERQHEEGDIPMCWCNPKVIVMPNGNTVTVHNIPTKIIKEADDVVLRASIGGTEDIGFYCTYRGDKTKVVEMLEQVLFDLKNNK